MIIREAAAELGAVNMEAVDDLVTFPLEANAEVLRDASSWACKQRPRFTVGVSLWMQDLTFPRASLRVIEA